MMVRKICLYLYQVGQDLFERSIELYKRYAEYRKFKDPRRVAIFSNVRLTREQKKEIDDFYSKNYGKKVPHTWHRHYMAFTGKFDVNYFPELLYVPEFERFVNDRGAYRRVFQDKNLLPILAKAAGVATPRVFLSCTEGLFKDAHDKLLSTAEFMKNFSSIGEAFVKPTVDSCSGERCAVVNMRNGQDTISSRTASQIIDELGRNFVVQERLHCHPSIVHIYPHSVNTIRIATYRWKNQIYHMPIVMRIGQGGKNVDNVHAGGIFIAVNDDGTLHSKAFTEFNIQYTAHPNTQVVFENYQIPHVDKIIKAARKLHTCLPQLGCYHWDFSLNEAGIPVLIEVNAEGGGIWLFQMAHGKGCFGQNTAEILQWMATMKKLSYSKRRRYDKGIYEHSNSLQ